MTSEVMAAIVTGVAGVIMTALTALVEWLKSRPAAPESKILLTRSAKAARRRRGMRLWLIVAVFCFFVLLTLIIFLGVQHEARQKVKKILYDSPEFHMNMGDQLADMGDFAGAALEYSQVIEDDQSDAFAHDKRAVALAKDGRLEEALEENKIACALAPDVAQYHNDKGVTLTKMGNRKYAEGNEKAAKQYNKDAIEAYKTAVELDSKVAEYHFNLSQALAGTYDNDGAISECTTALQLNPDNSEYHSVYAILLWIKGRKDNALHEARKAVELDPDNDYAYYALGVLLYLSNQLDEAVSAYRQAIQLNTDRYTSYDHLGRVLYRLGRYREALKEFESAIPLQETYPYQQSIEYYNAAYTLIRLNRYEEALQYVESGIEAYPDLPENHYLRYALLTYFNRHEEAEQERQAAYDLGLSEEEYT
ncbi:MAG: tetratricopeptide repeat protein [Oscillibacter sp.]|nr:tetratricopeptide repeat protein [Oscillibacter sp.]